MMRSLLLIVTVVTSLAFSQAPSAPPPVKLLVVDIVGDGLSLTSAADGVRFDVDGKGKPVQTAWTKAGSDDAFLVWLNGRRQVTSGADLLGTAMRLSDGRVLRYPEMALLALQEVTFDAQWRPALAPEVDPGFAPDDREFDNVRLWTDTDHNGRAEPTELRGLRAAGILDLNSLYFNDRTTDQFGNRTTPRSNYKVRVNGKEVWRNLWAVAFVRQ